MYNSENYKKKSDKVYCFIILSIIVYIYIAKLYLILGSTASQVDGN